MVGGGFKLRLLLSVCFWLLTFAFTNCFYLVSKARAFRPVSLNAETRVGIDTTSQLTETQSVCSIEHGNVLRVFPNYRKSPE